MSVFGKKRKSDIIMCIPEILCSNFLNKYAVISYIRTYYTFKRSLNRNNLIMIIIHLNR